MTLHLTAFKHTPEVEAATAFLDFQKIRYILDIDIFYARNNGGKGSLVAFSPNEARIGGFFDLVDWIRKNGHAKL